MIQSKYDGKCKTCGAAWKVGDNIDKQESGKWCANPNCGKQQQPGTSYQQQQQISTAPATVATTIAPPAAHPPQPTASSSSTTVISWLGLHRRVWSAASTEAALILPQNQDGRERMILAQVFYKKMMDAAIHGRA